MAKKLGINVDLKFSSKTAVKTEIEKVLESLPKSSRTVAIEIDTKGFDSTIKELSKNLDNINKKIKETFDLSKMVNPPKKKQLEDAFQTSQKINDNPNLKQELSYRSLQTRLGQIKKDMSEIRNIKIGTDEFGKVNKAVITYSDSLGKTIRETMGWKTTTNEATNEVLRTFQTLRTEGVNNYKQAMQQASSIDTKKTLSQSKLNDLKTDGNLSVGYINKIQRAIDKVSVKTLNGEFQQLNATIVKAGKQSSQIDKINQAINKANTVKGNMASAGAGDFGSQNLAKMNEYIKKLEQTKSLLSKGNTAVTDSRVDNQIRVLINSMQQYSSEAKQVIKDNRVLNGSFSSLGDAFGQFSTRIGMYSLIHMGINQMQQSMREGVEAVKFMDKALTTLSITMEGLGDDKLATIGQRSQDMAYELSTSSNKVLQAVQTFANAGEDIDKVFNKTKAAVTLSNLTGLSTFDTVNTVQSIGEQFEELADGSEASAYKITDSIIAISKSLSMDFGYGTKEMANGVILIGSLASQMGMSLDETLAMLSTGMEKLELSGLKNRLTINFH